MKFIPALITTLSIAALMMGCATRYPLDIPEEQWETMTSEQRLQARQQQAALDQARAEQRAAQARAREEEAARQRAELEVRRQEAGFGERIQCVLSDAEAYLGGSWRSVQPLALDLVQGMELGFEMQAVEDGRVRRRGTGHAYFDGTRLTLCPRSGQYQNQASACAQLVGTTNDYRRGLREQVDGHRFLRGQLRCDLHPASAVPRRRN
ncbi:hypothetical protein [Ectothiorhodospira sp. BSL-9]|uniref:hypothetical protein n=1 Tax=Ectothiorhodospira sp. BSL-9 TaxID=1442136 RepID=UPI0012E74112|nr:hypothetical protein [Ectothiorhodospira sp. BSL-9]